jgi:hypothetical protein
MGQQRDAGFERWLKTSTQASGVPLKVTDPRTILALAALVGRGARSSVPSGQPDGESHHRLGEYS